VSIPSRHPEVAEPQPNRSMQDLECYPAFGSSGSIHRGDEGSPLTPTLSRRARGKKAAFTLAEVLITLAIIGVVATMTIPTLISNYKKHVAEVKLSRFNSIMNQVIRLASVEHGSTSTWNMSNLEVFYNSYMAPYLRVTKLEKLSETTYAVYLADGTAFSLYMPGDAPHFTFYLDASDLSTNQPQLLGRNTFVFLFYPFNGSSLTADAHCNSPYLGEGTGLVPYFYLLVMMIIGITKKDVV